MDQREAVRILVQLPARLMAAPAAAEALPLQSQQVMGQAEDLSRHGVFVRTSARLPLGAMAVVWLELPDEQVCLRARVVRVVGGEHPGLALRFAAAPRPRRTVANYLMRCHADARLS